MFDDEDNNLSSFWFRANVGAQYKSDDLDGQVMLRIFAPEFGNTIEDKAYDKISANLYWANYKWALNDNNKLNLKFSFPLTLNLAYRVNALDNIQNTTYTTHRA